MLVGGATAGFNSLWGDAYDAQGAVLGNDSITGGVNSGNALFGDVNTALDNVAFGNDTLVGGADGTNTMYGDAYSASDTVVWGADRLVSGTNSNDIMWGDAEFRDAGPGGADTFVFAANNGQDTIGDFEIGRDKIDLTALTAITGFGDLDIDDTTDVAGDSVADTVITLSAGNTVTLVGVTGLTDTDFIFQQPT